MKSEKGSSMDEENYSENFNHGRNANGIDLWKEKRN